MTAEQRKKLKFHKLGALKEHARKDRALYVCQYAANALADDCKSIEDATKRLACYDRTETPPKVTDQQPLNTSLTPAMRELRSRLDKSFLAAGVNMDVMALSKRDEFTTGKLPHLQLLDK
jgi:hypothetical protein